MDQGYGSGWHFESKTFKTQPNQAQLLKFSPGIRGMMCFCNSTWKGKMTMTHLPPLQTSPVRGLTSIFDHHKVLHHRNKENWHLTIGKLLFVRTILLSSDLHPRKRRVHFPYKVWPSFSASKLHMPGPELRDLVPHSRVSLDPVAPTSSQKTSWRLLGNYIKLKCMPRKWLLTRSWEMMIDDCRCTTYGKINA